MSTSSLVALTLSQTITFLTSPLVLNNGLFTPQQLSTLQQILTVSFTSSALAKPSSKPMTLSFSPSSLPPRPIYAACIASGIRWADWIALLGNREFDLIVDTTQGRLSIRIPGAPTQLIWSTESERKGAMEKLRRGHSNRLSLSLINVAEEELSVKIVVCAPTPTTEEMERPSSRASSHASTESDVSTADSVSSGLSSYSDASSVTSVASDDCVAPAASRVGVYVPPKRTPSSPICSTTSSKTSPSMTTTSLESSTQKAKAMSRRDRARVNKIFIDQSKIDVTPYDGGKVGVLTGGVMLGGRCDASPVAPSSKKAPSPTKYKSKAGDAKAWRTV